MTSRPRFFSSSLGSKILIALSGLGLVVYLVLHLAGNLLVFGGSAVFNEYAHALISNPLVLPLEIALLLVFLVHIGKTVTMTLANRRARPVHYARKNRAGGRSRKSLASSTMIVTGLILAIFVIIHVRAFKFGAYYEVSGTGIRDLYRLEIEQFSNPLIVAFYSLAMVIVGFHLWHGIASAFQSLGIDHPAYTPRLLAASKVLAVVIGGGFLLIPLVMFFAGGRP
jgi:succinate dehydrogenase / fumarate reductase cytochrome b subunit